MRFKPIGIIRSPFKTIEDISHQRNADPYGFKDIKGTIEIRTKYQEGIKDIKGFSHLIILFFFHRSRDKKLIVQPPFETQKRGVFSTRSPHRPNAVGMTVVRLHSVTGRILEVSGIDMLNGTPVIDIKPYLTQDQKPEISLGWMDKASIKKVQRLR